MKTRILTIVILICSTDLSCKGQHRSNEIVINTTDTAVYNKLMSMEFENYIGKATVDQFLTDVGIEYKDSTLGFAPTSYLRYIIFGYSDKLSVEIQVNEFKHMSSWSPEHKWDIKKFKMEKIGEIRFKYLGECIKCSG